MLPENEKNPPYATPVRERAREAEPVNHDVASGEAVGRVVSAVVLQVDDRSSVGADREWLSDAATTGHRPRAPVARCFRECASAEQCVTRIELRNGRVERQPRLTTASVRVVVTMIGRDIVGRRVRNAGQREKDYGCEFHHAIAVLLTTIPPTTTIRLVAIPGRRFVQVVAMPVRVPAIKPFVAVIVVPE